MKFTALLDSIKIEKQHGSAEVEVSGLACDSRRVEPGFVFFALPGVQSDGFDFIPQAVTAGAVIIVAERLPQEQQTGVCYLQVGNVRKAMALIASRYHSDPTAGIPVIGVTGTNGKTSITYLLEAIMRRAGYAPAVFGTVEYRFGQERLESTHTTPESLELMAMMGQFRKQGADAIILEVSSHALEQHRVDGIEFDFAVFTNLTPEHLDYHQNLDNYFASKRRLFSELLGAGQAAINYDDGFGRQLLRENESWCSFGEQVAAQVHPLDVTVGRHGIHGKFIGPKGVVEIDSKMIGHFNVSNLLATVTVAQLLNIDNRLIAAGVAAAAQVPGRLERVDNDRDVLALVDYAHTGDALEQVLKTLSKLDSKRLITLVGCGGDRDPRKRPVMAAAAVNYSDLSVFTSDNPRTEDPLQILEQVQAGALAEGAIELSEQQLVAGEKGFVVIPDRREAIKFACAQSKAGDLLLAAGKGHEDYQILGTRKVHFDDREELAIALNGSVSSEAADV
ncbi:UDP-N-acetylmuramoylalanyl-D-glutamate--2,6-diaminopimelate ligase [Malonomonas rubra DSM 5091]|uniref:UDP-N-acetylmuramoyl-L-alanyl-D-glutamate--2,6-diaminopimelate ligase n=1 Tax=Malonomonas rubra DSM 5091 TaxID=1122189 RepID=A0A1M6E6F4_MALRU|nr:UDP-N-acetylmuramoyl-L-alanyl-D-glutamate--2,6-diaminopimelate ligase [Malonomonas rubra]SHI80959.1 UDP-N-acetylmuramoylalanyl-D-glutamate--2,6-diaminopimelate ligase [Malonomonas rubra DSM 5091]